MMLFKNKIDHSQVRLCTPTYNIRTGMQKDLEFKANLGDIVSPKLA